MARNPNPASRFFLIDGNSLAYRAFYALPDTMRNSAGLTTNAIYGFTTMLLKVLEQGPEMVAISFDLPEPTFRHKEYKEYKATRDKAPPTLHEQLPYIKQIAAAFDIPIFEVPGFEADDVIGTLARAAEKQELDVTILTGDRDSFQLINDHTRVRYTRQGISDTVLFGSQEVREKYGLEPGQLIDLKALMGDTSDNIPGVPGIGEKTAAQLLKEFGSLDNLLASVDRVSKKGVREKLKANRPLAELSRRLATIVTDVPLPIGLDKCRRQEIDWSKVIPLFEQLEFDRLVKKYGKQLADHQTAAVLERKREAISGLDLKGVRTEAGLKELLAELDRADFFAFDTETTSLNPREAELVGISFATRPKAAFYLPLRHEGTKPPKDPKEILDDLRPLFLSDKLKIGHNLKYDLAILKHQGIEVKGPYFDTMVAAYLLDPVSGKYALKKLGRQFLGREMIKLVELIGEEGQYDNFAQVPVDLAVDYAGSDAEVTLALAEIFRLALQARQLESLSREVEMPLVEVLVELESNGISLDVKLLGRLAREIDGRLKEQETQIFALAGEGFNLNSPKQLANILFNKLKLPVTKRTKTGPSTNIEVLEELAAKKFEIAVRLIDYRTLSKLKSTYVDVLPTLVDPSSGRIHASFNQTITATGRLSSSEPNLQNIPARGEWGKRIRSAFVPGRKEWSILAADYSQIELRVLAHLSQDPELIKAFLEERDVHQAAADELGISREAAKTVNFGVIYGISDFGLAQQLKIKKSEAADYIQRYFQRHQGVREFIERTIKETREKGYVTTLLGRQRPIPDINSPNQGLRSFAERTAVNTPVQGSAADLIKVAMVRIMNKFPTLKCGEFDRPKIILQVHDELVFECPNKVLAGLKELVRREMEQAIELSVPVKVDLGSGPSWAAVKN